MRRRLAKLLRFSAAALAGAAALLAIAWLAFPFPRELLAPRSASPLVEDRDGRTILALASATGEWRVPVALSGVSPHLVRATIAAEDERFGSHPGVDPVSALRAAGQNLGSGRVVSGASTLTMQLCRMLEPRPRTVAAKAVESLRALQLERILGKEEILSRYLDLAPYGGNVRGVGAASRIWFGKPPSELALAEAALLAGLPQSPTRYRPDLHPEAAAARRAVVLARMREEGMIDAAAEARAAASPIAVRPLAGVGSRLSAGVGRHVAFLALRRRPAGGRTTVDLGLQRIVEEEARDRAGRLPAGSDVAVVVIDVEAAAIRALVGSAGFSDPVDGQVNGAVALRSPGSALKPFLYAAAFSTGRLAPDTPVPDRPIERGGWTPTNFGAGFAGEVAAAEALRRSLNIPALLVAERTGLARCVGVLGAAGVPLPGDAAGRGGLALATGAIEVRLLDLVNAYATLARGGVHRPARLFADDPAPSRRALPAAACAAVDDALSCRNRPPAGFATAAPESLPWFMWKTGTSSRRRDAWAVGHNGRYAIGVWTGDFAGAGRYEYVGAEAAEPLLARLFTHPALAADRAPAPAPALEARDPWFADEPDPAPRILAPTDGSVWRAIDGGAIVAPRGNLGGQGTWFLDGVALAPARARRLVLDPGRHELRLVDDRGRSAAVRLDVR